MHLFIYFIRKKLLSYALKMSEAERNGGSGLSVKLRRPGSGQSERPGSDSRDRETERLREPLERCREKQKLERKKLSPLIITR